MDGRKKGLNAKRDGRGFLFYVRDEDKPRIPKHGVSSNDDDIVASATNSRKQHRVKRI